LEVETIFFDDIIAFSQSLSVKSHSTEYLLFSLWATALLGPKMISLLWISHVEYCQNCFSLPACYLFRGHN